MEVTLAIYTLNGAPYVRVAVSFDNGIMLGELVTGTELGLNSRTVDEYLFVGFKTVNLSEVI